MWIALATQQSAVRAIVLKDSAYRAELQQQLFWQILSVAVRLCESYYLSTTTDTIVRGTSACCTGSSSSSSDSTRFIVL
jgi:hypothetical protein